MMYTASVKTMFIKLHSFMGGMTWLTKLIVWLDGQPVTADCEAKAKRHLSKLHPSLWHRVDWCWSAFATAALDRLVPWSAPRVYPIFDFISLCGNGKNHQLLAQIKFSEICQMAQQHQSNHPFFLGMNLVAARLALYFMKVSCRFMRPVGSFHFAISSGAMFTLSIQAASDK